MAEPMSGSVTVSRHKQITSKSPAQLYTKVCNHSTNTQQDSNPRPTTTATNNPAPTSQALSGHGVPQTLTLQRRSTDVASNQPRCRNLPNRSRSRSRSQADQPEQRGANQHRIARSKGQKESIVHPTTTCIRGERAAHNTNLETLFLITKWVLISTIVLCVSTQQQETLALSTTLLPPSRTLTWSPPYITPISLHFTAPTHCPPPQRRPHPHTKYLHTQTLTPTSSLLSPSKPPHSEHSQEITHSRQDPPSILTTKALSNYQQWPPPHLTPIPPHLTLTNNLLRYYSSKPTLPSPNSYHSTLILTPQLRIRLPKLALPKKYDLPRICHHQLALHNAPAPRLKMQPPMPTPHHTTKTGVSKTACTHPTINNIKNQNPKLTIELIKNLPPPYRSALSHPAEQHQDASPTQIEFLLQIGVKQPTKRLRKTSQYSQLPSTSTKSVTLTHPCRSKLLHPKKVQPPPCQQHPKKHIGHTQNATTHAYLPPTNPKTAYTTRHPPHALPKTTPTYTPSTHNRSENTTHKPKKRETPTHTPSHTNSTG